jgi:hypothetical protein
MPIIKINGMEVEASLDLLHQLLMEPPAKPQAPAPKPTGRVSPELQPEYDGKAPHTKEYAPRAKRTVKNRPSSGEPWSQDEIDTLLETFPLSREMTPPISKIKLMVHQLPGRSPAAVQYRWYSLKQAQRAAEVLRGFGGS